MSKYEHEPTLTEDIPAMGTDFCGYQISLTTPAAVESWDRMHLAFLAHGAQTPNHLSRTLELEPGFAMGHAVKGLFYLMLGRKELVLIAGEAQATARAAVLEGAANRREQAYVTALEAWLAGKPSGAIAQMEQVLRDYPRDSLAAKISHAIRFILGDPTGMRKSIDAAMPAFGPDHPARGYMMGCQAFALEETGAYTRAEAVGRRGLEIAGDDAWGLHAVTHVYDMTGQAKAGLDWLTGRESSWAHCNNIRYHV
ncbi:MAG: tetratricopeptide repeat protein, partial [Halocynthiibacter sp.]